MALGKVYCFGPTFRAEKSKTRRHLTEFWMVEPEVAYATLDDIMELAENFISFIVERVLDTARARIWRPSGATLAKLETIKAPFPRISYDDAVAMLNDAHAKGLLENQFEYGNDFGSPDETYLSSQFDRPRDGAPLSRRGEGLLHGAGPARTRTTRSASTCSRRKATAKSSAARSASALSIC